MDRCCTVGAPSRPMEVVQAQRVVTLIRLAVEVVEAVVGSEHGAGMMPVRFFFTRGMSRVGQGQLAMVELERYGVREEMHAADMVHITSAL
ncbi:hypothetical protein DPMN_003924 [Dreissena polymorpha]|uniref:Uncharacterized protein n=1 Tax=Dreissena polymorpha TaxID=45954 RepID=A0A9D4MLV6_DREPO|nr:hypothetical protein DPMN_003924 [Dreissena polymorpha]